MSAYPLPASTNASDRKLKLLQPLILRPPQDTVEAVISFGFYNFFTIEAYALQLQQLCLLPIGAGSNFKCQGSVRTYHPKPGQRFRGPSHGRADHPGIAGKTCRAGNFAIPHNSPCRDCRDNLPYAMIKLVPKSAHRSSLLSEPMAGKQAMMFLNHPMIAFSAGKLFELPVIFNFKNVFYTIDFKANYRACL